MTKLDTNQFLIIHVMAHLVTNTDQLRHTQDFNNIKLFPPGNLDYPWQGEIAIKIRNQWAIKQPSKWFAPTPNDTT